MAVTEPLPLVPATWMAAQASCGRPSASVRVRMLSRPSLMPYCSRAKRRARTRSSAKRSSGVATRLGGGRTHEAQRAGDGRLQLAPIDDQIQHAVFEEELAALEALGQLLANGLLDDARTGKADQRLGLGDVEIAQHR